MNAEQGTRSTFDCQKCGDDTHNTIGLCDDCIYVQCYLCGDKEGVDVISAECNHHPSLMYTECGRIIPIVEGINFESGYAATRLEPGMPDRPWCPFCEEGDPCREDDAEPPVMITSDMRFEMTRQEEEP